MRRTYILTLALTLLCLGSVTAGAQNREHLQLTADLRMVQEQVSRLQQANALLTDQLKAALKRLDDLNEAQIKAFANQQVLINQISANLATVREKLDDNTVRVSQGNQELSAVGDNMRVLATQINKLVGLLQPSVAATTPGAEAPDPGAAPPTATGGVPPAPATGLVTLPSSPTRIFEQAQGLYMSGQYENAIDGFRELIDKYPGTPTAANAQMYIADSYFYQKKCREAIPEYQKVITTYKTSDRLAEAYYSQGVCYLDLNQRQNAQRVFDIVVKQYPNTPQAMMAAQKLQVRP